MISGQGNVLQPTTPPSTAPPAPSDGTVWFDTYTNQYKIYNGFAWYIPEQLYTISSPYDTALMDLLESRDVIKEFNRLLQLADDPTLKQEAAKYEIISDALKQFQTLIKLCENLNDNKE